MIPQQWGNLMRRYRRLAMLAAACFAMLVTTGHAQEKGTGPSANQVMKGCRALLTKKMRESGADEAFLIGACAGIVSTLATLKPPATGVCKPENVTDQQSVRVVVAYIDARPNRLHEDFRSLAVEALREAWPCQR